MVNIDSKTEKYILHLKDEIDILDAALENCCRDFLSKVKSFAFCDNIHDLKNFYLDFVKNNKD